jgi:hypothetical protein
MPPLPASAGQREASSCGRRMLVAHDFDPTCNARHLQDARRPAPARMRRNVAREEPGKPHATNAQVLTGWSRCAPVWRLGRRGLHRFDVVHTCAAASAALRRTLSSAGDEHGQPPLLDTQGLSNRPSGLTKTLLATIAHLSRIGDTGQPTTRGAHGTDSETAAPPFPTRRRRP